MTQKRPDAATVSWDAFERLMQTKSEGGVIESEVTDVAIMPKRSLVGVEDVTTDTVDASARIAAVKADATHASSPVLSPFIILRRPKWPYRQPELAFQSRLMSP